MKNMFTDLPKVKIHELELNKEYKIEHMDKLLHLNWPSVSAVLKVGRKKVLTYLPAYWAKKLIEDGEDLKKYTGLTYLGQKPSKYNNSYTHIALIEDSKKNVTLDQLEEMLEFVDGHRDMIKPKRLTNVKIENENWNILAKKLNCKLGPKRTPDQWRKTFNDQKGKVNKRARNSEELTDFEQRLKTLIDSIVVIKTPPGLKTKKLNVNNNVQNENDNEEGMQENPATDDEMTVQEEPATNMTQEINGILACHTITLPVPKIQAFNYSAYATCSGNSLNLPVPKNPNVSEIESQLKKQNDFQIVSQPESQIQSQDESQSEGQHQTQTESQTLSQILSQLQSENESQIERNIPDPQTNIQDEQNSTTEDQLSQLSIESEVENSGPRPEHTISPRKRSLEDIKYSRISYEVGKVYAYAAQHVDYTNLTKESPPKKQKISDNVNKDSFIQRRNFTPIFVKK